MATSVKDELRRELQAAHLEGRVLERAIKASLLISDAHARIIRNELRATARDPVWILERLMQALNH